MSIESTAKSLVKHLTEKAVYEDYLVKCAESGSPAVTARQWDIICDIAGGKPLCYHSTIVQARKNLIELVGDAK